MKLFAMALVAAMLTLGTASRINADNTTKSECCGTGSACCYEGSPCCE